MEPPIYASIYTQPNDQSQAYQLTYHERVQGPIADRRALNRGAFNNGRTACFCWCVCIGLMACVVIAVGMAVSIPYYSVKTQYTISIDSVSGLDNSTNGLSFNITLGVASRSHGAKSCIHPGMSVEVFYQGVQVAVSDADSRRMCAKPRNTAELPITARATGLPVGLVLETLEADMRKGTAVFDVKLHVPARSYGGIPSTAPWLADCKATRVGDAAVLCQSPDQS